MIEKIDGSLNKSRSLSVVIAKLNEVIDEINKLKFNPSQPKNKTAEVLKSVPRRAKTYKQTRH